MKWGVGAFVLLVLIVFYIEYTKTTQKLKEEIKRLKDDEEVYKRYADQKDKAAYEHAVEALWYKRQYDSTAELEQDARNTADKWRLKYENAKKGTIIFRSDAQRDSILRVLYPN